MLYQHCLILDRVLPEEVEMVYQVILDQTDSVSTEPNTCVAMEVWSPVEVIAAYSQDCTLRLFKAAERGGLATSSSSSGRASLS
jgi:hypothetical protein